MLSIEPSAELAKSTYEASLEVSLGEEKAFRNVRVMFKEAGKGEDNAEGSEDSENGAGTGSDNAVESGEGADSTGLFSFGGFSGMLAAVFTLETALNVFLVFVAAILLIAFIARFVKRLEELK